MTLSHSHEKQGRILGWILQQEKDMKGETGEIQTRSMV